MKSFFALFSLSFLLFVTSCRQLDVQRRYTSSSSLASHYVRSPDPLKENPPTGEKLWISWNLPRRYFQEDLILTLHVVKKNLTEESVTYRVDHKIGQVVYTCMDEAYKKSGGILTYKVELSNLEGKVLKTLKQALWFSPIHIKAE